MSRNKIQLPPERKLLWVGGSNQDADRFPDGVRKDIATALEVARLGGKHDSAKPWKGLGPHVFEIVVDDGDAYRAVYTVHYKEALYVLHAFQKKSTEGSKTSQRDIETIENRLRRAAQDYGERYGKKKKH